MRVSCTNWRRGTSAGHSQISDISRCPQTRIARRAAADHKPPPLRRSRHLPRSRPPVPLHTYIPSSARTARVATPAPVEVHALPERASVADLEDGAVAQRGADERMLEVVRQARERERERDDVRGKRRGLRVCETGEREGCAGRWCEGEDVIGGEERRVGVRLEDESMASDMLKRMKGEG
jgi:hypothetical protein